MKKFITILILALASVISFNVNAQVSYTKPTAKEYEFLGMGKLSLIHYLGPDSYTLIVNASSDSIDSSMYINLGNGKSQSLESLNAIKQMLLDAENGGFVAISGKRWKVTKKLGVAGLSYMQEYNISCNWIWLDALQKLIQDFESDSLVEW